MLLPQPLRVGFILLCFCWVTFAVNAQDNEMVSISGRVMARDNTPMMAVPVQAVARRRAFGEGQNRNVNAAEEWVIIAGTLSDEGGKYQFINMKPGRYYLRCGVMGGYVYYGSSSHSPVASGHLGEGKTVQIQRGKTLTNLDFHLMPFKKGTWQTYNTLDGLEHNGVYAIYQDKQGVLWFGIWGGGVSRYDGNSFVNFTTDDGLVDNGVYAIHEDNQGVLWFGTRGGISRYDGVSFVNFTTADGLVNNEVWVIHQD